MQTKKQDSTVLFTSLESQTNPFRLSDVQEFLKFKGEGLAMYPGLPVLVDANIKTLLQHYGGALGPNHFSIIAYWYSLQQNSIIGPSMCKI